MNIIFKNNWYNLNIIRYSSFWYLAFQATRAKVTTYHVGLTALSYKIFWPGTILPEMSGRRRKQRIKLKWLQCGMVFNDDYLSKHDRKYHSDILFRDKCISYEWADAPLKPFEVANKNRTNHAISEQSKVSGSDRNDFFRKLSPIARILLLWKWSKICH